jgi:phage shock protein PspC (stress-responsive transcriptional regulator)
MSPAPQLGRDVAGVVAGAALAVGVDRLTLRLAPAHRVVLTAAGLAVAAAIYPAARTRRPFDAHHVRVVGALGAYSAFVVAATRRDPAARRRLVAAGWASHAAFDAVHDSGEHSLIPAWYPAVCAGYDLATAGRLIAID